MPQQENKGQTGVRVFLEKTYVQMKKMSTEEIKSEVVDADNLDEWKDKAGGYGIQGTTLLVLHMTSPPITQVFSFPPVLIIAQAGWRHIT